MIAAWMLYSMLIAMFIFGATLAAERLAASVRWPTRWLWVLALAASIVVPAINASRRVDAASLLIAPATTGAPSPVAGAWRWHVTDSRFEAPIAIVWLVLSVLLVLRHARVIQRVRRIRRMCRETEADGQLIHVSPEFGPATIGVWRPMIVVPEWVFLFDGRLRQLAIAHEAEHVRSGDVRLLAAATAATILMPWNPLIWWQCARLRAAIEIDCDGRVMRAAPRSARVYGELLLEVAARKSFTASPYGMSLAFPGLVLERRIGALMIGQGPPASRVAILSAAAMCAVGAACMTPRPVKLPEVVDERRTSPAPLPSPAGDTAQRAFTLTPPSPGEFRLLGPASIERR